MNNQDKVVIKASMSSFSPEILNRELQDGCGYVLSTLSDEDYQLIFSMVQDQYYHILQKECRNAVPEYQREGMENYHLVYQSHHFNHAKVWHKGSRVLGPFAAKQVFDTELFRELQRLLGTFHISDEEQFGWPNVYWRLVRPGNSDIGSLHADKWFWDLGHGEMPDNHERIKVWIALLTESGKNGLRVVPDSHKKDDWHYHSVESDGMKRPVIDEDENQLDIVNLQTQSGDMVIFHDKLLHGGMPNHSDKTRLSLEFTLLVPLQGHQ